MEIVSHAIIFSEPGSSVSVVSGFGLDERVSRLDPRHSKGIFPLASVSRPALGPTQPPVQSVPGVTLTTHHI
jgi:hypothetical protein